MKDFFYIAHYIVTKAFKGLIIKLYMFPVSRYFPKYYILADTIWLIVGRLSDTWDAFVERKGTE